MTTYTRVNQTTYKSSADATTHTNTLGWTATAGNLLIARVCSNNTFNTNPAAGWVRVINPTDFAEVDLWWKIANGTETSLAVTATGSANMLIDVQEWNSSDGDTWRLDKSASLNTAGSSTATGTTGPTTNAACVAFAVWGNGGPGAAYTSSTETNSFVESVNSVTVLGGTAGQFLTCAERVYTTLQTSVASTLTVSSSAHNSSGVAVFYNVAPAAPSTQSHKRQWPYHGAVLDASSAVGRLVPRPLSRLDSATSNPTADGSDNSQQATRVLSEWFWSNGGVVTTTGSSAVTLANATSSATGSTVVGSSAQTLANATSSATGAHGPTGSSAVTLANATSSATGSTVTGTSARTLANATSSATGAHGVTGTTAVTLANATSSAAGSTVVGTSAQTLAAVTSSATGTADAPGASGTSATTLAAFTSTATGGTGPSGTSSQTLAAFTSTAAGASGAAGSSSTTLAAFTSTASGSTVVGSSSTTLAAFTSTASGSSVVGTSAQTLAAFTSTATGTATGSSVTGTVAVTLANATSTATGSTVVGTSSQTLAAFTSTATGGTGPSGTSARTLAAFTSTATGSTVVGSSAQTLAAATSTATGGVGAAGTLARTLANAIAAATGSTNVGTVAAVIAAFTCIAAGELVILDSTPYSITTGAPRVAWDASMPDWSRWLIAGAHTAWQARNLDATWHTGHPATTDTAGAS